MTERDTHGPWTHWRRGPLEFRARRKRRMGFRLLLLPLLLLAISKETAFAQCGMSFTYQQGGSLPPSQSCQLSNPGTTTFSFTATPTQTWISVSPRSGTLAPSQSVT